MSDEEDDIILSELDDEELVQQMFTICTTA